MKDVKELLSDRVREMPAAGMSAFFDLPEDVISLGLGEPGFSTPAPIGRGGIEAIMAGRTAYPPSNGYASLRQRISEYLGRRFGFSYAQDEVFVTSGASAGLDAVIRTFIGQGDEAIVPAPAYGYYASLIGLSGGKAVFLPTRREQGWTLDARDVMAAVTDRTKLLLLNYPNNPTGATMNREQYAALARALKETDILVVSDEIYAEFVYEGMHNSILHQPGMRKRTVLVSGFSKSMAMTGWRLGYVCAPRELIKYISSVHAAATLCAPGIAQAAAYQGLVCGSGEIAAMAAAYRIRRDYMAQRLGRLGWDSALPNGAFYFWTDISSTGMDSDQLARRLIEQCKVAVMPGTLFGEAYRQYVRITYSRNREMLKEAMDRVEAFTKRVLGKI